MKFKKYSRGLTITIALCLLLTSTALASIIGQLIDGYDVYLGAGAELSKGVYWTGSDYRTENYIEYSPNSDVYPVVISGSKVSNYGSFSSMASILENQGMHVIAGINGDYYVTKTSVPLGIVIEDGILRSSDDAHWAVGFYEDGSAIFGHPYLNIMIEIDGQRYTINSLNKSRIAGGAVILTDDFAKNTKNSTPGRDIVCSMDAKPTANSNIELTVENAVKSSGDMSIPEGKAIISVDDKASEELLAAIDSLSEGSKVKLIIECQRGWENVKYAIGSLYKLVTNGKVEGGLSTDVNPRTAVGMKEDGTVVFYTMDGRRSGHSIGVTMTQLANRMIELGCVEATIMDGGGSTSMNAIYLGDSSVSQINKPSEGSQRSVTNYIMLVTDKKATGVADRLALYPLSTNILSGASSSFWLKAADENGYAATLKSQVTLGVSDGLGAIKPDGSFVASGEGRGNITAEGEGLISAAANINVVANPDTIKILYEGSGKSVSSLDVTTETTTALKAQAIHNNLTLISQDECYTWSVTGDIGTIDAQGNFTAGEENATGSIVVSAGTKSVGISVTVRTPESFDDVKMGSWFYDAVEFVHERGLMNGTAERIFSPNSPASRAMVVTILHRSEGTPAPTKTGGFIDVPSGKWYTNAVYWASERGIAEGYDGSFNPGGDITREQLATILYRYFGSPPISGNLDAFEDAGEVSGWAKNAMIWANEKGIITGTTKTAISPSATATRAQIATILMRLST